MSTADNLRFGSVSFDFNGHWVGSRLTPYLRGGARTYGLPVIMVARCRHLAWQIQPTINTS